MTPRRMALATAGADIDPFQESGAINIFSDNVSSPFVRPSRRSFDFADSTIGNVCVWVKFKRGHVC